MDRTNIEKVKTAVHSKLDYSEYNQQVTIDYVNCYAHAIGATSAHIGIRLGDICGKKPITQFYKSDEEIEYLFLQDLESLDLIGEKIFIIHEKTYFGNNRVLKWIENSPRKIKDNLIVMLFVQYNTDGSIRDFHFWRFDHNGFSEKRPRQRLYMIENPYYSWPEGEMNHFIGMYSIKKKR